MDEQFDLRIENNLLDLCNRVDKYINVIRHVPPIEIISMQWELAESTRDVAKSLLAYNDNLSHLVDNIAVSLEVADDGMMVVASDELRYKVTERIVERYG